MDDVQEALVVYKSMNPREIEDIVARDILGWEFTTGGADYTFGPGWYKQDNGNLKYMGWPDQWATDMDSAWRLAAQLAKDGMAWQLSTMKDGRLGSFVELDYIPPLCSYHESVEAEAGPDQMPLAMCLALLKMNTAKEKKADGIKTI